MTSVKYAGWLVMVSLAVMPGLFWACAMAPQAAKQPNKAPVVQAVNYSEDIVAISEMQVECLAEDADSDNLTYEWSTDNGQIIGTGASMLWTSPDTLGDYEITVRVSDGKGGEVKHVIPIRVLTNADGTTAPPITLKMSLGSSEVVSENRTTKVGTATKITCAIDNVTGSKLSYEWSDGGGRLKGKGIDDKTAAVAIWTAPPLTQVYTVAVTVRDEQGNESHGQVLFDVFCCPRN